MHGHGFAPPQPRRPSTVLLVVVRIVLVALALLSFGLLAWGTMLRIAIMRGRRSDWLLFWLSLVIAVTCLVVIGEFSDAGEPGAAEKPPTALDYVCILAMLGLALGVPTHYLVADIRHYQDPRPAAGWPPPQAGSPYGPTIPATGPYGMPQQPAGYGYPPAQPPAPVPSAQPRPQPQPQPQAPAQVPAQVPVPPAQPPVPPIPTPAPVTPPAAAPVAAPATGRIDQVRAELDELSDLLRKEEDK